jgi:hypothetical protein
MQAICSLNYRLVSKCIPERVTADRSGIIEQGRDTYCNHNYRKNRRHNNLQQHAFILRLRMRLPWQLKDSEAFQTAISALGGLSPT